MKWLLTILFATALAAGQPYEIRGTVLEAGPNTGIPGVEVILTEFVQGDNTLDPRTFGTVLTDARGAFSFKPTHLGDFRLNIGKAGYSPVAAGSSASRGTFLVLTADRPTSNLTFALMQPTSLRGRVVDEKGDPVSGLRILAATAGLAPAAMGQTAETGADGTFSIASLQPGPYIVSVIPKAADRNEMVVDFSGDAASEEAAKVVDEDFEASYWPGGVADMRDALPLQVSPGSAADIGTVRVRRIPYYRAHVTLAGCGTDEKLDLALLKLRPALSSGTSMIPCRGDFILRNIPAGSYRLRVSTPGHYDLNGKPESPVRWASTDLVVARDNVRVKMALTEGTDVRVRFVTEEGTKMPVFSGEAARARLYGENVTSAPIMPAAKGEFVVKKFPSASAEIGVDVISGYYVKEIRYGNRPLTDAGFSLAQGSELQIVLDVNPASINGTVLSGGKAPDRAIVIVAKMPLANSKLREGGGPFFYFGPVREGQFATPGLAPGEYRVIATTGYTIFSDDDALRNALANGQKVTLERGATQVVELKLTELK